MTRRLLITSTLLILAACSRDPVQTERASLSRDDVERVHLAVLGVSAGDVVYAESSDPVDLNLGILRRRLDPSQRSADVERNLEILRERLDRE